MSPTPTQIHRGHSSILLMLTGYFLLQQWAEPNSTTLWMMNCLWVREIWGRTGDQRTNLWDYRQLLCRSGSSKLKNLWGMLNVYRERYPHLIQNICIDIILCVLLLHYLPYQSSFNKQQGLLYMPRLASPLANPLILQVRVPEAQRCENLTKVTQQVSSRAREGLRSPNSQASAFPSSRTWEERGTSTVGVECRPPGCHERNGHSILLWEALSWLPISP